MNVTLDMTDSVSAVLNVSIEEADYKPDLEKKLKDIARRAAFPGFRPGHVPAGLVKKRFGKQAGAEVVNDVVYKAVVDYIKDNKLAVLGHPVPTEVAELDLDRQTDFTFHYLLALAPQLDIELSKDVHMPYYKIAVTDEMVAEQSDKFRRRFGKQVPGEEVEPGCLIKGSIMELDDEGNVKEGDDAIQMVNGIIAPAYFKAEADKFDGKKVGDKVVFNPWNSCEGNPQELSLMLGIDKSLADNVRGDFEMAIAEILVVRPADMDQELFDNVLGKDAATTEEQYLAGVKAIIERDLEQNSRYMFRHDVQKRLSEKYADMAIPAANLKKWLVSSRDNITDDNVDDEFEKMLPTLKWQLIKEQIARDNDIRLTDQDLNECAKAYTRQQFAQYGMSSVPDDTLADYAKHLLDNKEQRERIIEEAGDNKLFNVIEAKVTLDESIVTFDQMKELAQNL